MTAKSIGTAGVQMSAGAMLTKADSSDTRKAYPDEFLSIKIQSKGKIKPGDRATTDNVENVHLMWPTKEKNVTNNLLNRDRAVSEAGR